MTPCRFVPTFLLQGTSTYWCGPSLCACEVSDLLPYCFVSLFLQGHQPTVLVLVFVHVKRLASFLTVLFHCFCRDINLLVWGVDLVEENFMAHVGIPVRESTHTAQTSTHTHTHAYTHARTHARIHAHACWYFQYVRVHTHTSRGIRAHSHRHALGHTHAHAHTH